MTQSEREKWDARYSVPGYRMGEEPKAWLRAIADRLPGEGRALDVAAGEGQNAVFLAELGLEVEAVDISNMGRHKAQILATEFGVTIHYTVADLDEDRSLLTPDTWDVITCFHYLNRELPPLMVQALKPGGIVAVEILGDKNLERHERPSARYLVAEGELRRWFEGPLTILDHFEGWDGEVYVCRVLAKKQA